jgi:N utilization substance protein B
LQVLFQLDLTGDAPAQVLERFWAELEADVGVREFTEWLVRGVTADREAIDAQLRAATEHWRLERIAVVDRNVLRMALFELRSATSPEAVVIDEAIEVAKRFGGEESGRFVNGVLEQARRQLPEQGPT